MKLPVTYVFTHDSIGVGEDGPTHEPIEQLAMHSVRYAELLLYSVHVDCNRDVQPHGYYAHTNQKDTPTATGALQTESATD